MWTWFYKKVLLIYGSLGIQIKPGVQDQQVPKLLLDVEKISSHFDQVQKYLEFFFYVLSLLMLNSTNVDSQTFSHKTLFGDTSTDQRATLHLKY